MISSFHANGKLLLTAEYFVLDGAVALALPVNRGQSLHIQSNYISKNELHWQSFDADESLWFEGWFDLPQLEYKRGNSVEVGKKLQQIFRHIRTQQPDFLKAETSIHAQTHLDFNRSWGLGTSSTLVAILANWAKINPFDLQFAAFGGSGYDIACANVQHPVLYQRLPDIQAQVADFEPAFKEQLYLVYLGKKQNSRTGIAHYRKQIQAHPELIQEVGVLTNAFLAASCLADFEQVLYAHEDLVAKQLNMEQVKRLYFADFWGAVKSLGAWGGDFVLVTSDRTAEQTRQYFYTRGFGTFFTFQELTAF